MELNEYLLGKKTVIASDVEDGSILSVKYNKKKISIEANKEGLLTLAKILISYAYDNEEAYPDLIHLYPSDNVSLEILSRDSLELIINKIKK